MGTSLQLFYDTEMELRFLREVSWDPPLHRQPYRTLILFTHLTTSYLIKRLFFSLRTRTPLFTVGLLECKSHDFVDTVAFEMTHYDFPRALVGPLYYSRGQHLFNGDTHPLVVTSLPHIVFPAISGHPAGYKWLPWHPLFRQSTPQSVTGPTAPPWWHGSIDFINESAEVTTPERLFTPGTNKCFVTSSHIWTSPGGPPLESWHPQSIHDHPPFSHSSACHTMRCHNQRDWPTSSSLSILPCLLALATRLLIRRFYFIICFFYSAALCGLTFFIIVFFLSVA